MSRRLTYSGPIIILMIGLVVQTAAHAVTVTGLVFDKETGNPIPDADIFVEETPFHASSRDGGYFFIDRMPHGEYSFRADVMGYEDQVLPKVDIHGDTALLFRLTPKPIQMDPVLITGTRSEHLQSQVTVSSKVLSADWIEKQNGNTAAEAIEAAGPCFVKDGGGFAGLKTLSIRGSGDSQVLVLLDGQRLNFAQDGSVDMNAIPMETLEKIEIVKGGQSALMGTDAVGGTVHLITRNALPPKGFQYGVQSTIGSFGTKSYSTCDAQRFGPVDIYLGYNYTKSKGDFSYTSPLDHSQKARKNNDYSGNNIFFKAKYDLPTGGKLQFVGHWNRSERGCADAVNSTFPSSERRRRENQSLHSLLFEQQIFKRVRLHAQAYVQGREIKLHSNYENDRHNGTAAGMDVYSSWILRQNILVAAGAEIRRDRLESTKVMKQERNTQSLTFETEISHSLDLLGITTKWKWIPAFRLDRYGHGKSHTCPKIGLLIIPFQSTDVILRGNYGESFRLPTFNDLYWPENIWPGYGERGNLNLKPETSRNWDIGCVLNTIRPGIFSIELIYFESRFRDRISWESDADGVWSPRNVGKDRVSGIENEWNLHLPNNNAYLTLIPTWMTSKDLTDNSKNLKLTYRPEFKLDVTGGFLMIGVRINANYRYVGKRYISADNKRCLPKYDIINGNVQYVFGLFGTKLSTKFQINNLLDKSIEVTEGYPIPGREMRFSFGLDW